ncbi:hypothetical protein BDQ12DRAFT_315498 [Crucibulum laeve]|uniref:Secreted protein n=1 Tax=Crucibulum laeve TaxID=68775 RepID=A0A5C3LDF2_9AGAR|nr:hypothetical protein BDQ12DRAFT_315498 [Crucibulum laeve]
MMYCATVYPCLFLLCTIHKTTTLFHTYRSAKLYSLYFLPTYAETRTAGIWQNISFTIRFSFRNLTLYSGFHHICCSLQNLEFELK